MTEDIRQHVDANSADFKAGVEAGLSSASGTKAWQAGKKLGQELKNERKNEESVSEKPPGEPSTPLFMSDNPEGDKGNAQDEKDETEE